MFMRVLRHGSALLLLASVASLTGCGDSPRAASAELDEEPSGPRVEPPAIDPCVRKAAGCPCTEPGKVAECGTVKKRLGDYEICYIGYRTCDEEQLTWGECQEGPTLVLGTDAGAPAAE